MSQSPLVSIALCTFNGEKYLEQQLKSIYNQTYPNLEIVIVDDNSTDNTFKILSEFANSDNRVKLTRNPVNMGFNRNFENAIKLTTGEYIALCDQDDIWLSEKIELLLANIKNNWLIYSNSDYINESSNALKRNILTNYHPANLSYKGFLLRNYVTGHTTLLSREFLNYALPIPENGFFDWYMGFVAVYHNKIVYLDKVLTQYRIHQNSVTQKGINFGKKVTKENQTILAMLNAFIEYRNLTEYDKSFIEGLKNAFVINTTSKNPLRLTRIILKYYKYLFPNKSKKSALNLLIFALKYTWKAKK